MAMSDTMSGPNDWFHFYQQNFPAGGQALPSSVSEATTVTTTISTTSPPLQTQLSPEGRVSKPIRRRSRASRRTPTTLLNTDTTNFRAMVQQFTGGPTAPFAPTAASGLSNLGFGFGSRPSVHANPGGPMLNPSYPGFHLQQQQQLYQQQQQQQQNQQYMYGSNTERGDNRFVQGPSNPTATATAPNVSTDQDGLFVDHGGRFFPSTSS